MYVFSKESSPKDIVIAAMTEIAEWMENDHFKFVKSRLEIIKRTNNFVFRVYSQNNRHNTRGVSTEIIIHCDIYDNDNKICFWNKTLAFSNAKQDQFHHWKLFGEENYINSMKDINKIISSRLLPFFRRFEIDLETLVSEVVENGFCAFGDIQLYDAGYKIPINFLYKYGKIEQINIAFQHYIDRHQLDFVKPNMQKAIVLLKTGKEITNNGEKEYAEFAVQHKLDLKFN